MPSTYRSPVSHATPDKTTYLTVRGKDTIFPGKDGIGIAEITDGTSNTILLVEAGDAKAVEWTKPEDFTYDPRNPKNGLFGAYPGGTNVALADGSVRFISDAIDPQILDRLFNRHDGQVIPLDALDAPHPRAAYPKPKVAPPTVPPKKPTRAQEAPSAAPVPEIR